jgi:deoxyribodipyrimidine photo-lyase
MSDRPSNDGPSLVWFRDDLRLSDNPALDAAVRRGGGVIALYVLDQESRGVRPLGGAGRWWLHHSLRSLAADLETIGIPLVLRQGAAQDEVLDVAARARAAAVFWNRRYRPAEISVDKAVMAALRSAGRNVSSFQANLLFEPWTVLTGAAQPFRVFTPFWKAARARGVTRTPLPAPVPAPRCTAAPRSDVLSDWALLPTRPDWAKEIASSWTPGEPAAQARLAAFVDECLPVYARDRDCPARAATSRLSPHLRFGEISPLQIWHSAAMRDGSPGLEKFLAELGWREFAWHLLHHFGDLERRNFNPKFDGFPWRDDDRAFRLWTRGQTGYPIVDAGMRQLWRTGWMHNRVRMIAASLLTKNLLIDWRRGEDWFWDTLVDADPANNPAGWQWVAGSGADAAPYFRVFNPVLQGEKFDPDGDYVREWVPELAALAPRWIHRPWETPQPELARAGVRLGETYPAPIVDHSAARRRALDAFEALG